MDPGATDVAFFYISVGALARVQAFVEVVFMRLVGKLTMRLCDNFAVFVEYLPTAAVAPDHH